MKRFSEITDANRRGFGPAFERETMKLEFFVQGEPKTQGSKRAIYNPKANRTFVKNDNEKTGSWRSDVRNEAQKAVKQIGWKIPTRATGINVEMAFFFKRPKDHYNSKGFVKDSAPENHTKRPDIVKCARAVEDALIGLAVLGGAGGFGNIHDYYNPINLNYIKNM